MMCMYGRFVASFEYDMAASSRRAACTLNYGKATYSTRSDASVHAVEGPRIEALEGAGPVINAIPDSL